MEIIIKNVSFSHKKVNILKNIDMKINNGEFIGIVGCNGSGKSTLLKCIYKVLNVTDGEIFVDDKEINDYSRREFAKKIAVVTQHNNYQFDFSVKDIVLMGRAPYKKALENDTKQDLEILEKALYDVGITHLIDRKYSTLSGGEQKRVVLARALVQETDCIILDEPTNHLDVTHQYKIMELLKNIGKTTVVAIHDLNIAARFCDRVYVLKKGEIAGIGTPKELFTRKWIKEIYDIDSEIIIDKNEKMHILF